MASRTQQNRRGQPGQTGTTMRQSNARNNTNKKARPAQVRPPSPASVNSGYSLYSTETEDQVTSAHRGLDRCAALLANLMELEEMEKVPTRLERNGTTAPVQQQGTRKGARKCHEPTFKSKQRKPSVALSQKNTVAAGNTIKGNRYGTKTSSAFNNRLVSSTPNQKGKESARPDVKKRKKPTSERVSSREKNKQDQAKGSRHDEKHGVRIPMRISPGKENVSHQRTNEDETTGAGNRHRFVETYEVPAQVLNEKGILTTVNPQTVRNPVLRESVAQNQGNGHAAGICDRRLPPQPQVAATGPGQPHVATVQPHLKKLVHGGGNFEVLHDAALQQHPQGMVMLQQHMAELPQRTERNNRQSLHGIYGARESEGSGNIQPWVSPLEPNSVPRTVNQCDVRQHSEKGPLHLDNKSGGNMHHQQHQKTIKQHGDAFAQNYHEPQNFQRVGSGTQPAHNFSTQSGLAMGMSHESFGQSALRSSAQDHAIVDRDIPFNQRASHLQSGPEKTTRSILRDLVGKLQEMNQSQSQHPQSCSGISQLYHNVSQQGGQVHSGHRGESSNSNFADSSVPHSQMHPHSSNGMAENYVEIQRQAGQVHYSQRDSQRTTDDQGGRLVPDSKDRVQVMEFQAYEQEQVPVRDVGQSCDQPPTIRNPADVVTQMQKMADQTNGNFSSPKPEPCEDDAQVQVCTPPQTSRPPVVATGDKGSNALWDQVRTLKYLAKELRSNVNIAEVQAHELISELEEVVETLPYTTLDRDLQTEVSLALQPMRSENSQLRRKLRLANQQIRQMELQAQGKESSQSGVSLEVLTLQSLNVNLQKQVEELHQEANKLQGEVAEMRVAMETMTKDKHDMQEIFKKMNTDMTRKRQDLALETSNLRQELTQLRSQSESGRLRLETGEREKQILKLSIQQRDKEILRLQEMTRNMQEIISTVVPERSPRSSIPEENKAARLENWVKQHSSSDIIYLPSERTMPDAPSSSFPIQSSHERGSWGTGRRSPHGLDSSQPLSSNGSTPVKASACAMHHHQPGLLSSKHGLKEDYISRSDPGSGKKRKPMDLLGGVFGRYPQGSRDIDSTLIADPIDDDSTAYMSFANPEIGNRRTARMAAKPGTSNNVQPPVNEEDFNTSSISAHLNGHGDHFRETNAGGVPSWVQNEPFLNVAQRRTIIGEEYKERVIPQSGNPGGSLQHAVVKSRRRSLSPIPRGVGQHRMEDRRQGDPISHRRLEGLWGAADARSVVSESTISSIATQYEARFQVGLSKLDTDIARLQQNLKGLNER